jgi:hypothetical protein
MCESCRFCRKQSRPRRRWCRALSARTCLRRELPLHFLLNFLLDDVSVLEEALVHLFQTWTPTGHVSTRAHKKTRSTWRPLWSRSGEERRRTKCAGCWGGRLPVKAAWRASALLVSHSFSISWFIRMACSSALFASYRTIQNHRRTCARILLCTSVTKKQSTDECSASPGQISVGGFRRGVLGRDNIV